MLSSASIIFWGLIFKTSIQFDLYFVTDKRTLILECSFYAPRAGLHPAGGILIGWFLVGQNLLRCFLLSISAPLASAFPQHSLWGFIRQTGGLYDHTARLSWQKIEVEGLEFSPLHSLLCLRPLTQLVWEPMLSILASSSFRKSQFGKSMKKLEHVKWLNFLNQRKDYGYFAISFMPSSLFPHNSFSSPQ